MAETIPNHASGPFYNNTISPNNKYAFEVNCLYVDNISSFVSKNDMNEVFNRFGELVNVRLFVKNEYDPESVQYGFVNFAVSADAQAARQALNGAELFGRKWK